MSTQPLSHDFHPGGRKQLEMLVQDFQLTMQHALRQDLQAALELRAKQDAGVLPEMTAAEMYDYLMDTDDEFINWCFPACAFKLTKDNMGPMHQFILTHFRRSLDPAPSESAFTETTDVVREGGDRP